MKKSYLTKILEKWNIIGERSLPPMKNEPHELMIPYSFYRAEKKRNREAIRKDRIRSLIYIVLYFALSYVLTQFIAAKLITATITAIYVILIPYLIYISMKQLGPTTIQLGKEGLRFHWAHMIKTYSSPWINWDTIDYISSEQIKEPKLRLFKREPSTSFDIVIDISKLSPEARKFVKLLRFFRLHHKKQSAYTRTIRIDQGVVIHEGDLSQMMAAFNNFLPEEKIDPTCLEHLMQSGDRSYTSIWLDQFDSTKSSNLLEPLPEGSIVGGSKYTIEKTLAAGGHAVTYLAIINSNDTTNNTSQTNSHLALKEIVLPIAGGKEIRKRALENVKREAEILKKLDHPQILKCLDVFTEGHKAYIALEFIEGESLRQLTTNSGPQEEVFVVELAAQMCDILEYLHSLSPPVLHRDFTPDNLILKPDNTITLIDFNVAEQREGFETSTVVGKHSYIPPEQFRGKPTKQSDIYSMGCCLFWLISGHDPEPITTSILRSVKEETSEELNAFVEKATEISLDKRFKSVDEMLEDKLFKTTSYN